MGATSGVAEADASVQQARTEVDEAETRILSGQANVTASKLHRLRDNWRHADLSARGARERAERERAAARLTGLANVGAEVDKLATGDQVEGMADALRKVAAAAALVRELADGHDVAVAGLVAAATDLGAEEPAPGGPRGSSSFVAVHNGSITHKNIRISPISDRVTAALGQAVAGEVDAAGSALSPVTRSQPAGRPDHLLRGSGGMLIPVYGPLSPFLDAQIRSGDTTRLTEHEVGLYMAGELS